VQGRIELVLARPQEAPQRRVKIAVDDELGAQLQAGFLDRLFELC